MASNILSQADADALETMVDLYQLDTLVAALAVICEGKAEHLRTNWQDPATAKAWERASVALFAAETKVNRAFAF
jgi:hypothetical protein